jgi:tetratricopeptide (TPR) repeat protein
VRRALLFGLLLIGFGATAAVWVAAAGPSTDPRDDGILRLEQWLKATLHHRPGERDAAAALVASWSDEDLRALWTDASTLLALMRDTRLTRIFIKLEPESDGKRVRYTKPQLQRLRILACAASGKATLTEIFPTIVTDPACVVAPILIDEQLRQLSAQAAASKRRGDPNFVVRRAAMLHADVVVMRSAASDDTDANESPNEHASGSGPRQLRLNIDDGRETSVREVPIHWMIGRMLLDDVRPAGAKHPAPESDEMVRRWYRASIAWMQQREDYDTTHVGHAFQLFASDPGILFLAACQRETFAAPRIQTAAQTRVFPKGFGLDVETDRRELVLAETLFRQLLALKPDAIEARLRHGHVLLRLERYDEAAADLRRAVPMLDADPELQYDGSLFLGAAEERLGHDQAAGVAFARAAALFPAAQSPWLSLSELAWHRGDRAGAVSALQHLFALPADASERQDPWWSYQIAQARDTDQLLDELRQSFRDSITP